MSLEKEGGTFIAQCDFCSNYIDTNETDFMSGIDVMKLKGWKVFKDGIEWQHKCDSCQASEHEKDFDVVV